MKKKAYIKNQIQIIKKTKARFLSIFCIVFLGAAFFAGLRHTSSIMEITMNNYLQKYEFNDLNYVATLGFSQDDVEAVANLKEVANVEFGNRFDALLQMGDNLKGTTVYTNESFDNKVNKVELVEGALPKKDDQCLLDHNFATRNKVKVGDKLVLSNDNQTKEFIVAGLINDPRYFSTIERGTNTLGDGTNDAFVEILASGNESLALPQDLYDLRKTIVFNEIRVTLKNSNNYTVFSDDYLSYIKGVNKEIKEILKNKVGEVNSSLISDANSQLLEGENEYNNGVNDYQDGLTKYNDGVVQYEDGLKQYQEGLKQYNDGFKQYQDGLKQYNDGKAQYDQGLKDYQTGKAQYDQGLADYNRAVSEYQGYLDNYKQLNDVYLQKLDEYNQYLEAGVPESQLTELKAFLDNSKITLGQLSYAIAQYEQTLPASKQELDINGAALNQAKMTLETTKATLAGSKAKLDKTAATLADSKKQLDSSKVTLDDTKRLLDETKKSLDEAEAKLATAKNELDEAHKALGDIPTGKLIALTREESASILSYDSACQSMKAIAVVFPLIFFLVAALVSLTTMTRMVEEQRVQSGTFRALGYDKKDVINQYLIYAFLATFIASVLGIVAGVYFFPSIIYFLYRKMLFNVGAPIKIVFDSFICIQTFLISVAITLLVTYLVTRQELSEVPASLLRPKAPKIGKRIVLERITFIWKKMSFNQKVTMRNIFRYKKRFFMSIIGIAGCTALIVTGFGIKNSVSTLADKQYGDIFTYDGMVVFNNDLPRDELKKEQEAFDDLKNIKDSSSFYRKTVTVQGDKEYYATLEVFNSDQELSKYTVLDDFEGNSELKLKDQGVIISAKLSELLGVKSGDKIKVTIGDNDYQVKVTGVMVLYFQHHIYMSEQFYKELTGESPICNYTYFNLKDKDDEKSVIKYCDKDTNISSLTNVRGISQSFRDQMGSIDSVVVILIACAGALAFIVLYNLTNINIQERKSEIATIKVLGFYPREVYDYVFRENTILSFIGSLIGLGIGKILHMFIISAVEVEVAMFIRSVNLMSYLYAIIITLLFTAFINRVMRRVLKNIDMVESLKSIE